MNDLAISLLVETLTGMGIDFRERQVPKLTFGGMKWRMQGILPRLESTLS